jgi:hypothetical protein
MDTTASFDDEEDNMKQPPDKLLVDAVPVRFTPPVVNVPTVLLPTPTCQPCAPPPDPNPAMIGSLWEVSNDELQGVLECWTTAVTFQSSKYSNFLLQQAWAREGSSDRWMHSTVAPLHA